MPLAEVLAEQTLWVWAPLTSVPTPGPLKSWAQVACHWKTKPNDGRDGYSRCGSLWTLVLQGGTQPARKWLPGPHPCVRELMAPDPLVSKAASSCWIRCYLGSLKPLRTSHKEREESSSILSTEASLGD